VLKELRGGIEALLEDFDRLCAMEELLDRKIALLRLRVDRNVLELRYTWQPVTSDLPMGQWYVCRWGCDYEVWALTSEGVWKDGKGAVKPTPEAVRWL